MKILEKRTYTQSYPHYPQLLMWFTIKIMGKQKKIRSVQNDEKILLSKMS